MSERNQEKVEYHLRWDEYLFYEVDNTTRGWFGLGGAVSLFGFLVGWFREAPDYGWDYGGWYFITDEYDRSIWVILVAILYVALLALCFRAKYPTIRALLGLGCVLSTIAVVGLAAAAAQDPFGSIELGIPIMVIGNVLILWGVVSSAAAWIVRDLVMLERHKRGE
jgi:hypothetical protein